MRVIVGGGTGLIGSALCSALRAEGHDVRVLTRGSAGEGRVSWDPENGRFDPDVLAGVDAVVNLAGTSIGERRWNDATRASIRRSRVTGTQLLADAIAAAPQPPRVFLSGSAVGFYGSCGDDLLDEGSPRGHGFLADLAGEWEAAANGAAEATRVVTARSGVVLSRDGGALAKQLLPFRLGLGGRLGPGKQWLPWISLTDEVRALMFLLASDVAGPVNLVAPNPVRQAEFARSLARVLRRPAILPTPVSALRLALGRDLVAELLLASQRVVPRRLLDAGFEFADPNLDGFLASEFAPTK